MLGWLFSFRVAWVRKGSLVIWICAEAKGSIRLLRFREREEPALLSKYFEKLNESLPGVGSAAHLAEAVLGI